MLGIVRRLTSRVSRRRTATPAKGRKTSTRSRKTKAAPAAARKLKRRV